MRIAIGSDHRGVQLKASLVRAMTADKHDVFDAGPQSESAIDYPDIAAEVSGRVAAGERDRGVLICGTGIGMSIAANKTPGIRAAVCHDEATAEICRRHNDTNVLCLPGSLSDEQAARIVATWLTTEFEGGRHARRLEKIANLERRSST